MKTDLLKISVAFSFILFTINNMTVYGQTVTYNPVFNPVSTPSCGTSRDFMPMSPSAASLGIYGQIPVGNYTGTAMVNIPIYEFKYKELSVPIAINYHASGNKPDIFPGPVGLGWSLQAGGCISRVIRGLPDYQSIPSGWTMPELVVDPRAETNWSSDEKLNPFIVTPFYTRDNINDPDEFYFNINGNTGKFFLDHQDTLRVQSTQGGDFRIIMYFVNEKSRRVIKGFKMIDSNGVSYIFGPDHQSMDKIVWDWTLPSLLYSQIGSTEIKPELNSFPMSWHLTTIQSVNGYSINFSYKEALSTTTIRFGDVVSYNMNGNGYMLSMLHQSGDDMEDYCYNVCYVSEISSPAGTISFNTSAANKQLFYPSKSIIYPHKFDGLEIYDKFRSNKPLICKFNYTDDVKTRLKLLSVDFYAEGCQKKTHRFEYNPTKLPEYLSWETDDYGFYNGKKLFGDIVVSDNWDAINKYSQRVKADNDYIERMKTPDSTYMKAEMLQVVHYPTGGHTAFEYEPHYYSSTYQTNPFQTIANPDGNRLTGGVRIRKISNYSDQGKLLTEKRYHYVKNYLKGGTASSGILTYKPVYIEKIENKYMPYLHGTGSDYINSYFRWSTNPVYPMSSTRGNHVTYTEVTVEETGNGYTVSKYKNYDNGYQDKELLNSKTRNIYSTDATDGKPVELLNGDEGISMGIERGQVLSEETYDVNKRLEKKTSYLYNDNPDRFNRHVRFLRILPNQLNQIGGAFSCRVLAGLIYTYFPYLKRKTEVTYLNDSITQKVMYTYTDEFRLPKTETVEDSELKRVVKSYTYAFEQAKTNPDYQEMFNRYMLSYPVEESLKNGSTNIVTIKRSYLRNLSLYNAESILLGKEEKQIGSSLPRLVRNITDYDWYGNPQGILFPNNQKVSILWSYAGQHPILRVEGMTYKEVFTQLGKYYHEYYIDLLSSNEEPSEKEIEDLRRYLSDYSPDIRITTYMYKPLVGIIYEKDPNGLKTSYYYDNLGRLEYTTDDDGNKTEIHQYHYKP